MALEIGIDSSGSSLTRYRSKDAITADARIGLDLTDHLVIALSGQQRNLVRNVTTSGAPVERRVIGSVTLHY